MGKQAAKTETPKKVRKAPAADLGPLQVHRFGVDGKVSGTVDLPPVFATELRTDLIRRAVTASASNRRQPYGAAPRSGMRHSVRWSGKGHGVSRVTRIRGTMIGAQAPGTVGGRPAFPPTVERIWSRKINEKERRRAGNAAAAQGAGPPTMTTRRAAAPAPA